MDDRLLVAAIARRDPSGLDGAYRRYADRLHAYCRAVLRDSDAAADVVQDTFVIAGQRVTDLRDPQRLRPWLYAIARNECLRMLRDRRRTAPLEDAPEPVADIPDPAARVHAAEVHELVWAAAAGLSPTDREVVELSTRHGLGAAEVAAVLGVSRNHAHARISRARTQLLRCIGAVLLARATAGECAALTDMLRGWDGTLTEPLRKRINRHAEDCAACDAVRRSRLDPAKLLAVYAGLPFAAAETLRLPGPPTPAPVSRSPGADPDPPGPNQRWRADRDGFPRAARNRRAMVTAAVLILALVGGGAGTAAALSRDGRPLAAPPPQPPGTAAARPADPGRGLTAPSATAEPSAIPTPGATGPPTVPPLPTAPPLGPPTPAPSGPLPAYVAAFSVTAVARVACEGSAAFNLTVGAEASLPLASATLVWRPPIQSRSMKRTAATARTTVSGLVREEVTWWVVARSTDGRTVVTPTVTTQHPCR